MRRVLRGPTGGYGLIEVLVAIVLVGTLALTLVVGLLFVVRTTQSTSELQQVQRTLANLSESVKLLDYQRCTELTAATPGDEATEARERYTQQLTAQGLLETDPQGALVPSDSWRPELDVVVELESVEFWQKVVFDGSEPGAGAFVEACPFLLDGDGDLVLDGSGQPIVVDDGTQLLTIRVSSASHTAASQIVSTNR